MNNITIVGNLTHDPEVRFGSSGKARATFTVAVNEKRGEEEVAHFIRCTAFGELGENIAESLRRGHRVLVAGRFDTYQGNELQLADGSTKRITYTGLIVSSAGPDLMWARARVAKVDRREANAESYTAPAPAPSEVDDDEEVPAKAKPVRARRQAPEAAPAPREREMASVGAGEEEDPF